MGTPDYLAIESVSVDALPPLLRAAIEGAMGRAGVSQLPVAILGEIGKPGADLVVMTLADFNAWIAGDDLGVMANTQYRAAMGDQSAREWLDVMTPDKQL